MTDAEFDRLADQMKPLLDPDLVILVEHEGEAVGFGLTVPDVSEPLRLAYPRPSDARGVHDAEVDVALEGPPAA